MVKFFTTAVFFSCLLSVQSVSAKVAGVTADGTWDCIDNNDASAGAVVIANTSYAFINPGGRVAAYGELKQIAYDDVDLPAFVILSGYLKDEMAAHGMSMSGPRENPHDLSGEHFLTVIFSVDNLLYCTRRKAP